MPPCRRQTLAIKIESLNQAAERRALEERDNKQREMHDLLTFVQGQIYGKGSNIFVRGGRGGEGAVIPSSAAMVHKRSPLIVPGRRDRLPEYMVNMPFL